MLSPGYSYAKAPDQEHFLRRAKTHQLFRDMLSSPKRSWRFNQSPLFLRFLMGKHDFECTPWGMPAYNIFGWQRPCYLLQDGYASSFRELMEFLYGLAGVRVVGLDIVEVAPTLDPTSITGFAAAKLVREAALLFGA